MFRVALVHDWLVTYRGGEKVLECIASLFPSAPIYTLFYDQRSVPDSLKSRTVFTPLGMNKFRRIRKLFLPIYPTLIESFDLTEYDLVISTSSCVAKGAIPSPLAKHISYIHSPMRYIWDQGPEYMAPIKGLSLLEYLYHREATKLRQWDSLSNLRVDRMIANSNYVKARIKRYYDRDAVTVYPPVDIERFKLTEAKSAYYLAAGALVPYKRIDLAIEACEKLNKRLIIAGSGPELRKLKEMADGNVSFVVNPSNEKLAELYANAKALLFPGIEDFGIVPIEAMACGTPVIAFKRGGSLDYIIDRFNGIYFDTQTSEALADAIAKFENLTFDLAGIREFTKRFDRKHFLEHMAQIIDKTMEISP